MTTYNTGNPIGSTDARDRSDNSENLDLAVNSLSQTFVDRLGVTRDTLEGVYQKSAYYRAGTFDAGYTLTNNRQTLAYGNIEYSWSGAFPKVVAAASTPETTGGVGAGAWVDRTQESLVIELNKSTGAGIVKTSSGLSVQDEIYALSTGQSIGVISFTTLVSLLAYNPAESEKKASYKVTNDPSKINNGYYHWVSAGVYVKDADIAIGVVSDSNTSDAVSGSAVRRFVELNHISSATPNLLDESRAIDGFIVASNGEVSVSSAYRTSDFIVVKEGATYKLWKLNESGVVAAARIRRSCYYDVNFNVVPGGTESVISTFTVPVGVKYVRISTYAADYTSASALTLVNSSDCPTPIVAPYYPQTISSTGASSATKYTYDATVVKESTLDSAVISRATAVSLSNSVAADHITKTSKSAFKNEIAYGDFIGGYPIVRSGSSIVDVSNINDFKLRGIKSAINQRTSGNEYIVNTFGTDISNKYVRVAFVGYSSNTGNLSQIEKAWVFAVSSTGSLVNTASTIESGKIAISDTMYLYYNHVVLPVGSVGFAVGSTKTPIDNSFFMSDFFASISDTQEPIQDVTNYVLSLGKSRFAACNILENTKIGRAAAYIGETSYIYGTKCTRIIKPFNSNAGNTASGVFNFYEDQVGQDIIRSGSADDVAPVHVYGTTLLANHSYFACRYTSAAHGKTSSDIGSIYTNNGNEYVLASIQSSSLVWLMNTNTNSDTYPDSGVFTYVSGGVSHSDISATGKSYLQIYPCYTNYDMSVYVDGSKLLKLESSVQYNDTISFSESYELVDRLSVVNWFKSGATTKYPTGTAKLLFDVSYRFDFEGNCTISANYTCADAINIADIMGLQAIRVDALDNYYIPKTKEFIYDGNVVNFSMIEPSTLCSSSSAKISIDFSPGKLDGSPIPSDRWLQIGSVGVFAMGFLPVGSAGAERAGNTTGSTMQIRGNTDKMYPRLVDKGDFLSTIGDSWSFVGYRNVHKPYAGATATYPVRTGGDDYYFIDYHNKSGLVSIPMPDDYVGRNFEIVEQRNINALSKVVSKNLTCLVNCASDYGYLVIRVIK